MAALLWSAGAARGEETAADDASPSERFTVSAPATDAPAAVTTIQEHYAKGRALYQQGRFEEARAEFAAALRLRQPPAAADVPITETVAPAVTPPPPIAPAMTEQARELYATGRALYQQGRFEEARATFASALQMPQGAQVTPAASATTSAVTVQVDIERPLPESLQTGAWLKHARRQREQVLHRFSAADKRLEQSRREVRQLRERAQKAPAQNKQRAKILEQLAKAEQAFVERQAEHQRLSQELEALTKREAALWYNWGVEADLAHDAGNAISRYRQAIALHPQHTGARYNLATALLKRRQLRQAEQAYRQLLAVDPQDADAHYNLGLIAEEYRQAPREALEHYRAYLASAPPEAPERSVVQGWINVIEGSRKEVGVE